MKPGHMFVIERPWFVCWISSVWWMFAIKEWAAGKKNAKKHTRPLHLWHAVCITLHALHVAQNVANLRKDTMYVHCCDLHLWLTCGSIFCYLSPKIFCIQHQVIIYVLVYVYITAWCICLYEPPRNIWIHVYRTYVLASCMHMIIDVFAGICTPYVLYETSYCIRYSISYDCSRITIP